jgi:hypothetical protein
MTDRPAVPTSIAVLWLCDADAIGSDVVGETLALLVAAADEARKEWPRIYSEPIGVRLMSPAAGPVSQSLADAAQRLGCALIRIDAPLALLTAQCDLAVARTETEAAGAGMLPVLAPPASAGAGLSLRPGGADPLFPARRRSAESALPADAALVAASALAPPGNARERRKVVGYLAERSDARVARHAYDLLLWLIGQRAETGSGADASWDRAAALARAARPGAGDAIEDLHAAYLRADALALAYGKRWRSTLVSRSLLLLMANFVSGIVGALLPSLSAVTISVQAAATILIFLDGRHAERHSWRQKWIDYRRLAESLRVARFLALCGAPPGRGGGDWVDWITRRVSRAAGACDALHGAAAPAVLAHLVDVEIAGQIAYHRGAIRRFRELDRRLARAANVALLAFAAFGAALAALALVPHKGPGFSIAAAATLALSAAPSLHARINDVRRALDVARQAARSTEIVAGLKRLTRAVGERAASAETCAAASLRAAEIMRDDIASWRSVVEIL